MDGNTRLCTATAGESLKQTFGSDGQPGTYYDIDETECLFLVGHNMAESAADIHLAPRIGTNVALLNGLLIS